MGDTPDTAGTATVRAWATEEWRSYRKVRLAALADAPWAFGSTLAAERALSEEEWRRRLAMGNALVAEVRGNAQGLVAVIADEEGNPGGNRTARIVSLWVHPGARGRGVGGRLVEAALERARKLGFARVRLWVAEGNSPAERLYARYGFTRTGEERPVRPGEPAAEFAMSRPLTPDIRE